jgi:hypothetical protein
MLKWILSNGCGLVWFGLEGALCALIFVRFKVAHHPILPRSCDAGEGSQFVATARDARGE